MTQVQNDLGVMGWPEARDLVFPQASAGDRPALGDAAPLSPASSPRPLGEGVCPPASGVRKNKVFASMHVHCIARAPSYSDGSLGGRAGLEVHDPVAHVVQLAQHGA